MRKMFTCSFSHGGLSTSLDYAQVRAYDDNGGNQARYTRNGSGNPQPAEPLYAGLQDEWVEERMSLNEFKGHSIYISFELISNSTAEYDGFYFDDLSIVSDTVSNTQTVVPLDRFVLRQNQPNPASRVYNCGLGKQGFIFRRCQFAGFQRIGGYCGGTGR